MVIEPESNTIDPGAAQLYTITMTNRPFDVAVPGTPKGLDATNVIISGEHGEGMVLARIIPTMGSCAIDQTSFNCSIGSLGFGESVTIAVEAGIDPLAAGNALLTLVANRTADMIEPLEEEGVGVVQVNASGNPPNAVSLSKLIGLTTGGLEMMIAGQDFDADAQVLFDNLPATEVEVVDSTTIKLITPAHSEGSVDVIVVNSDEQTTTLPDAFRYLKVLPVGGSGGTGGTGGTVTNPVVSTGSGSLNTYSIIALLVLLTMRHLRQRKRFN
jgi:hypothetical protein